MILITNKYHTCIENGVVSVSESNERVSQMQALLVACREPTEDQNRLLKVLYVFELKT